MKIEEKIAYLPVSELERIRNCQEQILEALTKRAEEDLGDFLIDSKSIPRLLKISNRTWSTYRATGEIPYIQIASKIWVKRKDLEAYLEKYYVPKK